MSQAIFERRGEAFWATELARGPWNPNAQHGGAPAALLAGELEKLEPQPHMRIVREPRSEWVELQAHTRMIEGETALAQAVLFDTEGRIGRSLQSLYVAQTTG